MKYNTEVYSRDNINMHAKFCLFIFLKVVKERKTILSDSIILFYFVYDSPYHLVTLFGGNCTSTV